MQQKKSNRFIYYHWLILGLLLTIVIVGCTVSQPDVPGNQSMLSDTNTITIEAITVIPASATSAPSTTPTPTSSITPSPSATPTTTATAMPSPSSTPTATFTPAPTLTPLPTIFPQQRGQAYTELMSRNGGCMLPCWWGFELGKMSIDEVRQFYAAFDTYIVEQVGSNGIDVLYAQFVDPQIENGEQVVHSFVAQDGIIIEALIDADDPNYQIEPLLRRLGLPSEVWMWTIPEPREGILPSRFRLYFPEQGIFVLYATGGEKSDDAVNVCFDEPGGVTLLLWSPATWDPDGTKGIVDRANEGGSAFTLEGYPIDEVSNWDVEQFYTILTDPNRSECLETPSNLWSPP